MIIITTHPGKHDNSDFICLPRAMRGLKSLGSSYKFKFNGIFVIFPGGLAWHCVCLKKSVNSKSVNTSPSSSPYLPYLMHSHSGKTLQVPLEMARRNIKRIKFFQYTKTSPQGDPSSPSFQKF